MRELDVCLELFLGWLADAHGRRFAIERTEPLGPGALAAQACEGSLRLSVEAHSLLEPAEDHDWTAERDRLAAEIGVGLPGAYAIWMPPGADIPAGDDQRAVLVERARVTAAGLEPGQRSSVALPVSLYLRKREEGGALVSVSGGLNAHWARLSEKVHGTYDLDSTRLHRLPDAGEHLESLMETIWERAAGVSVGESTEIETVDAWTMHRLESGESVTIVGRPPGELRDTSLRVRRNFRSILAEAGPRLRYGEAALRALFVLGFYGRLEEEGATTAMRGYDPGLYAALEVVCLVADGLIKPLIERRTGPPG